ncbi:thioredoxin [Mesobacillus campisalis]|uniref:Thioredoxin n=1 Tax=Mesobacillus campisalis TaxID=1408103 RepID=A0A0M2SQ85_9BACI|nr:thioredoxin family protein [Mesobacillus campisalis]KKK36398.1 thioredoxin [Mesobacillus campisalis]
MEKIQNQEQYSNLVNGVKAVVMYFSADWCSDCRFIDTFMNEIKEQNQRDFCFYKVDADSLKEICIKANVMGIPSFVIYQQGNTIDEFIGNDSKTREQIEEFLEKAKVKL